MSLLSFDGSSTTPLARDGSAAERKAWWRQLWSRREGRLDQIRRHMLSQLNAVADAELRASLAVRIKSASDAEPLWALRQEWMDALAAAHGPLLARQRLSEVSFMFAGLLDREHHASTCLEALQPPGSARGLVRSAEQRRTDH